MNLLISKAEIENLNKEYKNSDNIYDRKEALITQMFTIKIYNLIKEDYELGLNYINKIFNISSICEECNLYNYGINNTKLFLNIDNDVLIGFMFDNYDENSVGYYSNIIKISNDFILINNITISGSNENIPSILKNLIESSNIEYLEPICTNMKANLNDKCLDLLEERFLYNMFVEYQFRKAEFLKLPLTNDEKNTLKKFYNQHTKNEPPVEKYIFNKFKYNIINDLETYINTTINEFKNSMSKNILNLDYLYKRLAVDLDELIIELINSPIFNSEHRDNPILLLDLLFIKEDIYRDIERKELKNRLLKEKELKELIAKQKELEAIIESEKRDIDDLYLEVRKNDPLMSHPFMLMHIYIILCLIGLIVNILIGLMS